MMTAASPYYLVVGLGASGLSMARFLHDRGQAVKATDIDAGQTRAQKELNTLGIETQIGFHDQSTFDNAACLIPSPGIPLTSRYIAAAAKKGVPVMGELDIFSQYNRLPVIAVTGTNGKTTTTTLIGELLAACKRKPFVGGNIGTPLVEQLMSDVPYDIIVAEISSFQLDLSNRFRPDIGLLLNISEDHLDRYDTYTAYEESKWRMFDNQTDRDTAIINADISKFDQRSGLLTSQILSFSSSGSRSGLPGATIEDGIITIRMNEDCFTVDTQICPQLYGIHNHENMAAAILACLSTGADITDIQNGLAQFNALPHRMEASGTINGIRFYNDSKATNTDAVIRALECFDHPVVLILGGREKGTDFSQLVPAVKSGVKTILAIGESKPNVIKTFEDICPVIPVRDMAHAVAAGVETAASGDIVLLSPACASFDMYDNYVQRGNDFKTCVNKLEGLRK